ncbi:peptide ABC transporter substrate-binding protein [Liquorilactobacillus mali]|uniref:ABC transporter periplasmic protein n=1 Tax=Liquorilactobacillus mali KCTC 3596 = DSM 20444 TaxID=1046596 RepID=J0URC7_9LACO|nr:peptide ABC transporter substrate-binding protein [Liquorilactobacillus mali]EJE98731.1 ABC transporter periplasmic protein [Liquorilactobacillus mali KCTC 3596 = DSM 20444]KRN10971.1 ABC transporter periplasmic protein [Liquorilactobacillus mali KCTC 3596 = DSM 20444]MDV7757012.1 peptide ABC transporter substrate-binding protein [Liquorilactobacillus mali]QFQ74848.1 peptide ABC transporter substrate-binding protein [Liquorilactobacillus mali]
MEKKRLFKYMFTALIAVLFLSSCSSRKSFSKQKTTLNLMQTSDLTTLDNTNQATMSEFSTLTNLDEGLYKLNSKNEVVPAIAKTIAKPTNNGKTYTINLRKDARWSNGDKVTAQDFVYSWRRSVDPANKPVYTYVFSGIKNADAVIAGKISPSKLGIKAIGKYKLEIILEHPMQSFNKLVTMPVFLPQDKVFVQKIGTKKYGSNAKYTVSNGAFKITKWTGINDSYLLVKNKYYYAKKRVKLNKISYTTIKDDNTAYNLFKTNKLDDATVSGVVAQGLQNNKNLKKVSRAWTYYLQVNQSKGSPLANAKLRKAVSLVINRKELTQKVLGDGSTPAGSFVSPKTAIDPTTGKDFSTETATSMQSNVKEAKRLWKEGLSEIGKSSVTLSLIAEDTETQKKVAEYIQSTVQSNLSNVSVKVQNLPAKSLSNKKTAGEFDLSLWYWLADYADPINYLGILTTGNSMNPGKYSDSVFDSYLANAQTAKTKSIYWANLRDAEKKLQKTTGIVPLYYVKEDHLVQSGLSGVVYHTAGFADYTRSYWK